MTALEVGEWDAQRRAQARCLAALIDVAHGADDSARRHLELVPDDQVRSALLGVVQCAGSMLVALSDSDVIAAWVTDYARAYGVWWLDDQQRGGGHDG